MSTILFILIGIKLKMGIAYWVLVYFKSLFEIAINRINYATYYS